MDRRHRWLKRAPMVGGALVVVLLIGAMVWFIRGFLAQKTTKSERVIQNITVIRPPPPPPPEEKPPPPPPEKVEQQIQQKEPEPTPDNTPAPQQQLGLDAQGGAGDDGFGLAARPGGTDIAGTGGAAFAWYTSKLSTAVNDRLSNDPKLRAKKYTVNARVWIDAEGRVKQVKLTSTSGSEDVDREITAQLSALGQMTDSPPLEMPQPISLQIVSRS